MSDWGARAIALGAEKQLVNAPATRGLAMMHVAMFEAVNAMERRYRPYKLDLSADKTTSREAAAAAAAHAMLMELFPDQKSALDQALQAALASVADGDAKTKGIELGRNASAGIVALRINDGISVKETYRPQTKPGVYVPTMVPIESTSGGLKPWVMDNGSQYRPDSPPALDSEVWTRDLNEIRELGSLQSKKRSDRTNRNRPLLVFDGAAFL